MNESMLLENKEDYHTAGLEAKAKMEELIKKEGITLKTSYEISFDKSASIACKIENLEMNNVSIILPKLTDKTDMQIAITMAHELGHYYAFNKAKKWKRRYLYEGNSNNYIKYYFEKLAWKEAKILMMDFLHDHSAKADFDYLQRQGLLSYKPKDNLFEYVIKCITKPFSVAFTCLFFAYVLTAFAYLLIKNNIPIPYVFDPIVTNGNDFLAEADFYSDMKATFFLIMIYPIFKWIYKNIARLNTKN
ncbi:hypothetical protein [Virgibacillus sp. Bac332]|uniref:hypothetical protein n=1 Tax=Virgibacillus sp. Bac332 TaxID=2419842 RepID=UPI000EF50DE5|nr:hypothetical protein [Virgibacillus sp. Bac332]